MFFFTEKVSKIELKNENGLIHINFVREVAVGKLECQLPEMLFTGSNSKLFLAKLLHFEILETQVITLRDFTGNGHFQNVKIYLLLNLLPIILKLDYVVDLVFQGYLVKSFYSRIFNQVFRFFYIRHLDFFYIAF